MDKHHHIIIVGAGLSGLTLAYLFLKHGIKVTILEASQRAGGRIQTIAGNLETPLELGATWFSDQHSHMLGLLDELGLAKFPQYAEGICLFQTKSFEPPQEFYVPASDTPSYRIAGGTQKLTDTLLNRLPDASVLFDHKVISVKQCDNEIEIETSKGIVQRADKVVICMPPQLAGKAIRFLPVLPQDMMTLLPTVQTWMAGAIKFVVEYENPFWREKGYSGMLYSHAGIITEMYDHTNFERNKYGFTGFLNGGATSFSFETRREVVLKQLSLLLGPQAESISLYMDKIWSDEFIIENNQFIQMPHQHNGHPLLQESFYKGTLYFCGTETATIHAGYMEGAIQSAKLLFAKICK